jgi:hypothetical protein
MGEGVSAHTEAGARRLDYFVAACVVFALMTCASVATALVLIP